MAPCRLLTGHLPVSFPAPHLPGGAGHAERTPAIKILIHSNAPFTATAYGQQTALISRAFGEIGHDVAVSCMTGVMGRPMEWEGIPLLPMGITAYSSDILAFHARHFFGRDPGLVLIHYDAWAIEPGAVQGLATAAWTPVHSKPMSRATREFFHRTGAVPLAPSRFSERMMAEGGLQPVYVPHAIDTTVFRPIDDTQRSEVRKALGIPEDRFIAVIVAANKGHDPPRKGWGEQLAAFARFHTRHPESLLFIHTPPADLTGIDLRPLIADLAIGGAVIFSDDYAMAAGMYTPAYIAALLAQADVLLSATWCEGFGIPIIEAQACGTPVIVADSSSMPELLGAGWKVPTQQYWHPAENTWWYPPSIQGITTALERAWQQSRQPGQRAKARARARAFAEDYDIGLVVPQYWKPALEMLEQVAGAAPVRLPRDAGVPLPTTEQDGLRWLARGSHTDDWIATGHEAALEPLLTGLLPDGGVYVDVGAHIGRWVLRLARKASRVVAVEANPLTASALRYHLAVNQVTNVTVVEAAAWDEPARLTLSDPNDRLAGGSTRVLPAGEDGQVDALPLDVILADEERIDLIKLDVEGADLRALAGMAATLERCAPVLFIEDHSIYGYYERSHLFAALDRLGYDGELFTAYLAGDRTAPYVIARPRTAP